MKKWLALLLVAALLANMIMLATRTIPVLGFWLILALIFALTRLHK